ncbi:hypothetical protein BDW42DRAFT_136901 [Aspergillus taichungensis]|uniref:Uncharacterized protein n=1 Tax=Aspergillus taichungensis TaxID=482145 RepID=A0A2J5HP35_9EURO|nr:hypothetical protein BDW42DRAFT_136901 [Aspergillus taichungensis]
MYSPPLSLVQVLHEEIQAKHDDNYFKIAECNLTSGVANTNNVDLHSTTAPLQNMCNVWTCRILYMYLWTPRSDLRVANRANDETSDMQAYSTIHVSRLTNERTEELSRDGGHETNVPEPGIIASSPSLRRPNQKFRRVIPGGNSGRIDGLEGRVNAFNHTCL